MSFVAPVQKRPWLALGAVVALIGVVFSVLLLTDLPDKRRLSERVPADAPAARPLPQARWRLRAHPSGLTQRLTKAQNRAIDRQAPVLKALVRDVYESLFLRPGRLRSTLKKRFTPAAARALRRSGAGASAPGRARTTRRSGRIGIDPARGARLAVASITVRAIQPEAPRARPVVHRSTLWLQRASRKWTVIAFEVQQRPVSRSEKENAADTRKQKAKRSGAANPMKKRAGKGRRERR